MIDTLSFGRPQKDRQEIACLDQWIAVRCGFFLFDRNHHNLRKKMTSIFRSAAADSQAWLVRRLLNRYR